MPGDGNAKPPRAAASGTVDASNIDANQANAAVPQSGEGARGVAASAPPSASSEAHAPGVQSPDGTTPRRYRGRRRIRERAQVRARLDELAGKLERKQIDPKTAAIMVQTLNGILACLNAEKDEALEARLAAVERKVDKPGKRGTDA